MVASASAPSHQVAAGSGNVSRGTCAGCTFKMLSDRTSGPGYCASVGTISTMSSDDVLAFADCEASDTTDACTDVRFAFRPMARSSVFCCACCTVSCRKIAVQWLLLWQLILAHKCEVVKPWCCMRALVHPVEGAQNNASCCPCNPVCVYTASGCGCNVR